jgi:hypothetical protein
MYKLKIEGDSVVQHTEEFSNNEQVSEVNNNQTTDSVTTNNEAVNEAVNEGVNQEQEESQNVLKFNSEDEVLEYLKSKEELLSKVVTPKQEVELPEDVKKYLEFKSETGRSFSDFQEYQKDFTKVDEQDLVRMYLKDKNPEFDADEIQDEFLEAFAYDEDIDDEKDIKKKIRAFKKAHADALEYFNSQKEKYAVPVTVSSDTVIPQEYQESKAYVESLKAQQEIAAKQSEVFLSETDKLFNNEFKGFEFKIGDEVISHKPSNIQAVKEAQSNVMTFFSKFLDENGFIKDPVGYHKALYVAMNYDSILSNVYETARAKAIEDEVKNSKNIDMKGIRTAPEGINSGLKFKIV